MPPTVTAVATSGWRSTLLPDNQTSTSDQLSGVAEFQYSKRRPASEKHTRFYKVTPNRSALAM